MGGFLLLCVWSVSLAPWGLGPGFSCVGLLALMPCVASALLKEYGCCDCCVAVRSACGTTYNRTAGAVLAVCAA